MRTRSNFGITLVLAMGLLLAWTGTHVWAGENLPLAGAATAALTTVPNRLAPGQVPPPTFEAGRAVPNAPWSANTLLATDTNASGYSPPDGGITVNGNNVFATMNYFPNNAPAGWAVSRSTNRGTSWLAPYQWGTSSSCGGDPTPFRAGPDTTYLIEFNSAFTGFSWNATYNGGTSWNGPTAITMPSGRAPDKEMGTADTVNTQYLYLSYSNFTSSYGACDIGFFRSTNHGTTWSTEININSNQGSSQRQGSCPAVGRGSYQGHVYVVWQDDSHGGGGQITFNKSTDHGVTWGTESQVAPINQVATHTTIDNWRRPMHDYPAGHVRPFPNVVVDSQGRIIVCYNSGNGTRHYDPMITTSTNEGTTWSTPVAANMAVSGDTADQYLPWCAVDTKNTIHVFWCDMRNYNNTNGDMYYAYSMDHGVTFSTPEEISSVTPCLYGSLAANYQGDYNMICADTGRVFVEWCDNRTRSGNWQDVDAAYRQLPSGVEAQPAVGDLPKTLALGLARPNPVTGATEIHYQLPASSPVQIRVYDMAGKVVKTLVDEKQESGYKSVTWDGRNDHGVPVGSGVYLYRIEAGSFTATGKMVVVR